MFDLLVFRKVKGFGDTLNFCGSCCVE